MSEPDEHQAGGIFFRGKLAVQFWVRTLRVEREIEYAQRAVMAKAERKQCTMPIIHEYHVDQRLKLIYLIVVLVDALGLRGGQGVVYYASPSQEAKVRERRDRMAEALEKEIHADEVLEAQETKERYE